MRPVRAPGQPEGLILYDGECVFCSRWGRWVIERDPEKRYRFAAVQGSAGRQLAEAIGIDPDLPESNAVVVDGMALFKSDATLSVLSSLTGWGWTRLFLGVPRSLRDWAYDRIANNRYRFLGRVEMCLPPPTETRDRFLS